MPYKEPVIEKLFYTIGEVAKLLMSILPLCVSGKKNLILLSQKKIKKVTVFLPKKILKILKSFTIW
jgi:hypothetical protein